MPLACCQFDAALLGVQYQARLGDTIPSLEDESKLAEDRLALDEL